MITVLEVKHKIGDKPKTYIISTDTAYREKGVYATIFIESKWVEDIGYGDVNEKSFHCDCRNGKVVKGFCKFIEKGSTDFKRLEGMRGIK